MKVTPATVSRFAFSQFLVPPLAVLLSLLAPLPSQPIQAQVDAPLDKGEPFPVTRQPAGLESCKSGSAKGRLFDPVLVQGQWLNRVLGSPVAALRLHRCCDGGFETIRFQVDERTAEGDWVFPQGKKNNRSEGNGVLDGQDVLLFMAKDAGQKKDRDAAPPGASSVVEIELEESAGGNPAWVYLACYDDPAPPLCPLPDYVRYKYETEEVFTDTNYSRFIITEEGLHTSFSDIGAVLPAAGGNGENRMDRMKTRIQIRFFFNLIRLSFNEETLGQDVIAYITGPVRVIRRMEQFFKLPFGLRGLRSVTDLHLYESLTLVPAEISVPRGADRLVTYSRVWFGADFSPNVIGSLFRNSENLEPLIIDGRMSEQERQFSTKQDRWRVYYGPTGAMLIRGVFPPEYLERVEIRQRYVDDLSVASPPERYEGSIGLVQTEIVTSRPPAGRYRILMEVCFPPHYEEGDETECLKVRDDPLRIRIDGKDYLNRLEPCGPD